MNVKISEQNQSTTELVDAYEKAVKELEDARMGVNRALDGVEKAERDLAKRLCPDDAANGESFSVWAKPSGYALDMLYTITKVDFNKYEVKKRR